MSTAAPYTPDSARGRAERLEGVACVVTGGARGIGYETARELARLGASVGLLDLDGEAARLAAARVARDYGVRTAWSAVEIVDPAGVAEGFRRLAVENGEARVLVNCAGIMTPRLVPVADVTVEEFRRMLDVHVAGAFHCARAALPAMQRAGFGRIVNISSVLGLLGLPSRAAYGTAKTAIIGLTRALAVETARQGITVNAVAPGYILTETLRERVDAGLIDYAKLAERAPAGRWGLPQEVARVIGFLALPASGFITGTVIPVDGGYTMRGDPDEDLGPRPDSLDEVRELFRNRP